ncbi:MAG: hypothetical protein FWE50_03605 [Alphaproteobacteria bacterium]|nr:hypothetical protein [Alphaproteobacteria bacterium]
MGFISRKWDEFVINNILDVRPPYPNKQKVCGTDDAINKLVVEYELPGLGWTEKHFDLNDETGARGFFNDAQDVIKKRNGNKTQDKKGKPETDNKKSNELKVVDAKFLGNNKVKIIYEDGTAQEVPFFDDAATAMRYYDKYRKKQK